ncbi:MAG: hypothetical protein LUQ59_02430 [Methanothrix sp.]|nr:hypothetical protein [Methanothrix sp.]
MQSAQEPINSAVLAAIISAMLVGMVTYFANKHLEEHKAKLQVQQQQRQAYSQLRGLKYTLSQVYVTHYELLIYAIYYKLLSQQTRDSSERNEYIKKIESHKHRCDDLIMELARNNRELWELIGSIETIFPHTQELDRHIKKLESYDEDFETQFRIQSPFEEDAFDSDSEEIEDPEEIERFKFEAIDKAVKLSKEKIDEPIDNLLEYLNGEIEKKANSEDNEDLQVWRTTILP